MKRYHLVAVACLIFGGLLVYMRLDNGDTSGAIEKGVICILLGVVAFLYEKLKSWLNPVGSTVPLIIIGLMAAHAAFTGDIAEAIFLCIGVIGTGIHHFFQDTPFVKEKIEPYMGMIVLLIVTLFVLFDAFSFF